jgi:protein-disulfide isomerase
VRQKPQPPLTRRERRTMERQDRSQRPRPRPGRRPARPAWQSPFAIVTVGALVVALAIIILNQRPSGGTGGALTVPPLSYATETVDGTNLGPADAPVVLAVYSDFQCPVCGRFVREQLGSLITGFVDKGILRIESHDIPILGRGTPDESVELATGARCAADQGRYWQFHDYVFWNQQNENQGDYSADFIRSIATASGVDVTAWDACVAGTDARATVKKDAAAALAAGINSTPRISLNGSTPVAGLPDAPTLISQIQALASAASPSASATAPAASPSATAGP